MKLILPFILGILFVYLIIAFCIFIYLCFSPYNVRITTKNEDSTESRITVYGFKRVAICFIVAMLWIVSLHIEERN